MFKVETILSNTSNCADLAPLYMIYAFGVVSKGFSFFYNRSSDRSTVADYIEHKKTG